MGVWERSPAGIEIANATPGLMERFRRTLPDFRSDDNVGSAYCVRRYVVDRHLGGPEGLAVARKELARRGMQLLLDFVPNHAAPDCPAIAAHPEHFMQGDAADLQKYPDAYLQIGQRIFARAKDPYFPPWPDVIQVNAFQPGFKEAVLQLLLDIAQQCDGVRCDMAMLLMNQVFAQTWGARAGTMPPTEYWPTMIGAVKKKHPQFLFIAEAYWDLEWALQQQGFDFCYDKRLYDRLVERDAQGVCLHLAADSAYQEKLLRFLENHDEPRAAVAFSPAEEKAAALILATVPAAKLFFEGQFEGRKVNLPTFLGRQPREPIDLACVAFYKSLLAVVRARVFREGHWLLCTCSGWPDNQSFQNLAAWCWTKDEDRRLVIVNFNDRTVEARVHLPWQDLAGKLWHLDDALSAATYDRDGNEMHRDGLYIELQPWAGQILAFHPSEAERVEAN